MPCTFNDPSVFDRNTRKKFKELKLMRKALRLEKQILADSSKYAGRHPHDIALNIQIITREIGLLFNEIRPKIVLGGENQLDSDRGVHAHSVVS